MNPGELYNRHGKTYMIIDLFERSWSFTACSGDELDQHRIPYVSCMGPDGPEEFQLDWFCRGAEAFSEA